MTVGTTRARTAKRVLVASGALLLAIVTAGFADVRSFDQTRGGYEPPYTGYTGNPIDWSVLDKTPAGMMKRGYVMNVYVDCTSGMMHFGFFGVTVPFREFSPRALAVHKPREACEERGFSPEF